MLFDLEAIREFPIEIYGEPTALTDTMSLARVRIFYEGRNRNGSYITDEFANQLIETLPYSPVKGIWEDEDFTSHGTERTQGRAFGVTMSKDDMAFAWEDHLDKDGVVRTYACANVVLWTALYEEARKIPGKSQSMELYEPSIEGVWEWRDGMRVFRYTKASFLGLQVLGDDVEPCFEDSAFFSLYSQAKEFVSQYEKIFTRGGQSGMPNNNPEQNPVEEPVVDFAEEVKEPESEPAEPVVETVEPEVEEPVTDNPEEPAAEPEEPVVVEEPAVEPEENHEEPAQEPAQEPANPDFAALTAENERLNNEFEKATQTIETLNAELEKLRTFKLTVERERKTDVLNTYAEKLSNEIIENYTARIDEFTVESLEKELAYEFVKATPSIFSAQNPGMVLKDDEPLTGLAAILSKYENK